MLIRNGHVFNLSCKNKPLLQSSARQGCYVHSLKKPGGVALSWWPKLQLYEALWVIVNLPLSDSSTKQYMEKEPALFLALFHMQCIIKSW